MDFGRLGSGRWACAALATVLFLAIGCKSPGGKASDADLAHYVESATQITQPAPNLCDDHYAEVASIPRPITLTGPVPTDFWDISLQEAVQLGLQNSTVLRDLGGSVLRSPDGLRTIHNPAIQDTDPRYGIEAALSQFDAQWSTLATVEKNDRALNNRFLGGGTRLLQQDLFNYSTELSKRSAAGTLMTARNNVVYDFNNAPGNDTPNKPWMTNFELEMRQPLLRGGGVDFNRIAGPNGSPGVYNGVLIARINTDISLADFEAGVREFVNDIETAYWELYFAYRDLDAKLAARDQSLVSWERTKALEMSGRRGGGPDREARAREQYYRLEADVQNALSGRNQERSRGTTFRGVGGIHGNERRLRLLLGLPVNDQRLLRPATEPPIAPVSYEWDMVLAEALTRRVELRRQQWKIKRRELELVAAKNMRYPQLDAFGRYRWRGLGHDLIEPNGTGRPPFNDAVQNLFDGDFQEWQLGVEFTMPVGQRQASAAIANAELNLHREHAILNEQQRDVSLEVSNAIAEKDRSFVLAQTNFNRRIAAEQQLAATDALYQGAEDTQKAYLLDLLLDAQRRLADANTEYVRSLVDYAMSIKQIHYAKGSLLDYNEVYLSEGPWPHEAYHHTADRAHQQTAHSNWSVFKSQPLQIGTYSQDLY